MICLKSLFIILRFSSVSELLFLSCGLFNSVYVQVERLHMNKLPVYIQVCLQQYVHSIVFNQWRR